ncbi:MAG: MarR family winged helix-turn-helix transcriptional regulator [Sphingomicrobium sp.]
MSAGQSESHDQYQPHTKQSLRLWLRLLDTTTFVEKNISSYLKANFDSTLPRFDVLAALDRAGAPLTMSELSQRLLVSNGNVTGVVARLVEDGFVVRETDEADRRTQRVSLSRQGRRHFAGMAKKHEALVDEFFGEVSDAEMERLVKLLTKLNKSIHDRLGEDQE